MIKPIEVNRKYIVAVSGGVDSMTLLDLLIRGNNYSRENLIIAHFDHGIRDDSSQDIKLIRKITKNNSLILISKKINLGPKASESEARLSRYNFLEETRKNYSAHGIIMAHHQDDLIETFLINLIRGTNRRGLSSLSSSEYLYRPLLNYSKAEILEYAYKNKIQWREDSTNSELKYLRNYLRNKVTIKIEPIKYKEILDMIASQYRLNKEIDLMLEKIINNFKNNRIPRLWFIAQDLKMQKELIAYILRFNNFSAYSDKLLTKVVLLLKVLSTGGIIDVSKGIYFKIEKDYLALKLPER